MPEFELAVQDEVQKPFIQQAKTGDAQAAIVVLKIQTRRAQLLGLDAPLRLDPVRLVEAAQLKLNSTEQVLAAIYRLKADDPKRRFNGGEGYGHFDEDAEGEKSMAFKRGAVMHMSPP